jgi:hypothetical protein
MSTPAFANDDRELLEDPPLDPNKFTFPGPLNSRPIGDVLASLVERGSLPSSPPVLVARDGHALAAFRDGGDTDMWRFWSPTCLLVVLGPSVPDEYANQKVLVFAGELTEAFSFPGFSPESVGRLLAFDTPLVRLRKATLPGSVPFLELAGGPCVHPLFNSHLPVAAPVAWIDDLVLPYDDSLAALPVGYISGPRGGSSGTYQLSDARGSLCSFPTLADATRSFAYANARAWNSSEDPGLASFSPSDGDPGSASGWPSAGGSASGGLDTNRPSAGGSASGAVAGTRRVPPMTFLPWTASPGGGVPDHVPLKPGWFSRGLSGWFDSTSGCLIPVHADVVNGECTCDRSGTTRACAPFECAWLNADACLRAGAPPAVLRWITSDPKRKVATHPWLHRAGRLPGPMFEHPPGNFVPISSRLAKTLATHFDDPVPDTETASFVVADVRFNAKLFRRCGIPVPSVSSGETRFSARVYDEKVRKVLCSATVHRLPDYLDDARSLCSLAPDSAATTKYLDAAERHPLVRVTLPRSTAARHLGGRPFEHVWVEISVISTTAGRDGVLPKVCAVLVPVRITAGFLYRKRPGTRTKVDDWPDDLVLVPLRGAPEALVRAAVACGPFEAAIADREEGLGGRRSFRHETVPACKRQCLDEGLGSASSETSVRDTSPVYALFLLVSCTVLDRPEHKKVSEVCEFGPNELQQFLALSQVVELGGGCGWTRRHDDDGNGSAIVPRGGGVGGTAKKIEWEFHSGCPYAGSIHMLVESAALLLEKHFPTPGALSSGLDACGLDACGIGGSTLLEELWKLSWVDRRRLGEHLHAEKQRIVARSKWIWTKYCRSPDVLWRHRNTQADWVCDPIRAGLPRESALGSTALVV